MKWSTRAVVIFVFFSCVASETSAVICRRPPLGRYVLGKDATDSVSLIKQTCPGMKNRNTKFWIRGVNVQEKCQLIRPMAAIATFAGPNNKYGGGPFRHSAIFVSCAEDGIWVYDQWSGSRGVRFRKLFFTGLSDQHDAGMYHTILTA